MSTPKPLDAVDSDLRAHWTQAGVTVDALPSAGRALGRSALDAMAQTVVGGGPVARPESGPGLTLGPEIGRGGQAVVHSAEQTALRRTVAVKIPRQADEALTSALLREAWVASSLEHPNILPIHALASDERGAPLLIMKRIEGIEWSSALEDSSRIPGAAPTDILEWHLQALIQLCHAVEFAHSRDVLHLDIKPSNVMLGAHGEVYLLDWGLAVTIADDAPDWLPRARDVRRVLGTPAFMSPEQARGDGRGLGPATDIYLLGAVLYTVVNGRRLRDTSPIAAVTHAWRGEIPAFEAWVPAELERICRRALSRAQDDRFPTVAALRAALETFLRHRDARTLAHRARLRMSAVLADPFADPRTMHEVRYGLQQALEAWPGQVEAAEALQRLLVRICEAHLERGEAEAAAGILLELRSPEPALTARVEALRADLKRQADEVATLRRDRDLSVNRRIRNAWLTGLGCLWLVVNMGVGHLNRTGILPIDFPTLGLLSGGTVVTFIVCAWLVRDTIGKVDIDRRMINVIGGSLLTAPFLWFICARTGLTTAEAMSMSTVLYMLFVAAQTATLERRLAWVALFLAPVVIAAGIWPAYGFEWAGVAGLICGWVPRILWRNR